MFQLFFFNMRYGPMLCATKQTWCGQQLKKILNWIQISGKNFLSAHFSLLGIKQKSENEPEPDQVSSKNNFKITELGAAQA